MENEAQVSKEDANMLKKDTDLKEELPIEKMELTDKTTEHSKTVSDIIGAVKPISKLNTLLDRDMELITQKGNDFSKRTDKSAQNATKNEKEDDNLARKASVKMRNQLLQERELMLRKVEVLKKEVQLLTEKIALSSTTGLTKVLEVKKEEADLLKRRVESIRKREEHGKRQLQLSLKDEELLRETAGEEMMTKAALPKMVVVGAPGVGKTSFLQRLQSLPLSPGQRGHVRTVECSKPLQLSMPVHVLDSSACMTGEEYDCCFSKATCIVFMLSVTQPDSVNFLLEWLQANKDGSRERLIPLGFIYVIGNKCDVDVCSFPENLKKAIQDLHETLQEVYGRDQSKYLSGVRRVDKQRLKIMEPVALQMNSDFNEDRAKAFARLKLNIIRLCPPTSTVEGDSS